MPRGRATHVLSRIPPPLLYAGTLLLGLLLQRNGWPRAAPLHGMAAAHVLGFALGALGLTIALTSIGLFARSATTLVPHGKASRFVTGGFYRISRNPMYLSLALAYLGVGLWLEGWLALALLPIPVLVMEIVVIPMEEAQLRQRFGSDYEAYCRRVRRWL